MDPDAMLKQAEMILDREIRCDVDRATLYTLQAIGYALVAIGRELREINAKRPVIPLVRVSDPAAECEPEGD